MEYLIKSLVNLRGDYNQIVENLIKEANNKNLSSDDVRMQEVLNIKRKYEDAWKKWNRVMHTPKKLSNLDIK